MYLKGLIKLKEKIKIYKYSYIETPVKFKNSKFGQIKSKNKNDSECFKWPIARSDLIDEVHPHWLSTKIEVKSKIYNCKGIGLPVQLKQICKIEK